MTDDYYLNLRCHSCFAFTFIAATTITTISTVTATNNAIYRLGRTDCACHNCKKTGDKWYIQMHDCSGNR